VLDSSVVLDSWASVVDESGSAVVTVVVVDDEPLVVSGSPLVDSDPVPGALVDTVLPVGTASLAHASASGISNAKGEPTPRNERLSMSLEFHAVRSRASAEHTVVDVAGRCAAVAAEKPQPMIT